MKTFDVDAFFTTYTHRLYKRGEVILRAGDPPVGVLYLVKGYVRMSATSENGDILVLHVFKRGSFFPMWWAINDTPNTYTYEAVTPVEAYRAPKANVVRFLKHHPDALFDLTRRVLAGLSGVTSRMEMLVFDDARTKTIQFLVYCAKHFGWKDVRAYEIVMTQREIAAWIGTTRETASLQLEALKHRGLIVYKNRMIRIPDLKKLEEELGGEGIEDRLKM